MTNILFLKCDYFYSRLSIRISKLLKNIYSHNEYHLHDTHFKNKHHNFFFP